MIFHGIILLGNDTRLQEICYFFYDILLHFILHIFAYMLVYFPFYLTWKYRLRIIKQKKYL